MVRAAATTMLMARQSAERSEASECWRRSTALRTRAVVRATPDAMRETSNKVLVEFRSTAAILCPITATVKARTAKAANSGRWVSIYETEVAKEDQATARDSIPNPAHTMSSEAKPPRDRTNQGGCQEAPAAMTIAAPARTSTASQRAKRSREPPGCRRWTALITKAALTAAPEPTRNKK